MAGQPHDKTGRQCSVCAVEFGPQSLTLTISVRQTGYIEKRLVCPSCHNDHYAQGE